MLAWSSVTCGTASATEAAIATLITVPHAEPRQMHLVARQSSASTTHSLPERIHALRLRSAVSRNTPPTIRGPRAFRRPSCARISVVPAPAVPVKARRCLPYPAVGLSRAPVAITGTLGGVLTVGVLSRPSQLAWGAGARFESSLFYQISLMILSTTIHIACR